jgi:hypothetical protein
VTRKTSSERANINARAAISTARTRAKIRGILADTEALELGTIDRAIDRAYTLGWSDGIKDYTEGE